MLVPVLYTVSSRPHTGGSRNARARVLLCRTGRGIDWRDSGQMLASRSCPPAAHKLPLQFSLSCLLHLFQGLRRLLEEDLRNHKKKLTDKWYNRSYLSFTLDMPTSHHMPYDLTFHNATQTTTPTLRCHATFTKLSVTLENPGNFRHELTMSRSKTKLSN